MARTKQTARKTKDKPITSVLPTDNVVPVVPVVNKNSGLKESKLHKLRNKMINKRLENLIEQRPERTFFESKPIFRQIRESMDKAQRNLTPNNYHPITGNLKENVKLMKIQKEALLSIKFAIEQYGLALCEVSKTATTHAKRVTAMPRDIEMTNYVRGVFHPRL
jgi:histone H3/H4